MPRSQLRLMLFPCLAALAPMARAQEVLFELTGASGSDPVGDGVVAGDWNGDGIPDLALAWRYDDTIAKDAGALRIHSGADGSVLQTFFGATQEEYFGIPTALPDLDGDSIPELLVRSAYSDFAGKDFGSVTLFQGGTGTQLWRFDGTIALLGIEAGPMNDLDGDGVADLFVTELGAVHALSGATGTPIFTISGARRQYFGICAIDLGDVNGDGVDDLMVGAPDYDATGKLRGRATIYSGADQTVIRNRVGSRDFEHFGFDLALVGDFDGDGRRDYAVVSEHEDVLGNNWDVIVRVYSSATHGLLAEIRTPDPMRYFFFPRIEATQDVNGDGIEDFSILANTTDSNFNSIWAPLQYSGRSLEVLYSFEHFDTMGVVTSGAGDFDGDGFGDLFSMAMSTGGHVRIYGGDDLWLNVFPRDPLGGSTLVLTVREGTPNRNTAMVIVGVDGVPTFVVAGGLGQFDVTGGRSVSGFVPPGLAGHDFDFKCFADDAQGRVIESAVETVSFR